jgi:hypothetical protein
LAQLLQALAQGSGKPERRAWAALSGMTVRICGRFSAEARAVDAASAADAPDRAAFSSLADVLSGRARTDPGFASGFVPWLGAAQMLLPPRSAADDCGHDHGCRLGLWL